MIARSLYMGAFRDTTVSVESFRNAKTVLDPVSLAVHLELWALIMGSLRFPNSPITP